MAVSDVEVAIVGGGAAGIAAARRLHNAGLRCLLIEARDRLGGRAWTVSDRTGLPVDLGCGWLHSADRNPWGPIAAAQGRTVDKTPPPWARESLRRNFSESEQREFHVALDSFSERVDAAPDAPDRAAVTLLEPGNRWNGLIGAVYSYISGAPLERISVRDLANYADSNTNWRIAQGYGTTIAAHAANVRVAMGCPVHIIDHAGKRVRIETAKGAFTADRVIIAVPSALIAAEAVKFTPTLPEKIEAARGLPLGLDDKLFLSLSQPEEFAPDSGLFGHTDRAKTGAYSLRPLGRPQIEAFFGGDLATELEAGGEATFLDFAVEELTGQFGSSFAKRVGFLGLHRWGSDPFARGSYSFALPGCAEGRARLAAPVDDRLFFAGEACSMHDYSTAHGAYLTGIAAAEAVLMATARLTPPAGSTDRATSR
jgi:monoamine oxidase